MKINQIVHLSESVSESTGDKPFDQMMTTIKQGTNKQKTADRKEQQKQTQQQARNAFGNMFGGGNPADKLKIREQGVAEGLLNEFARGNGGDDGDDGEEFNPDLAKMAQEHGFTKGVSLADGSSLATAFKITKWDQASGGLYKQYFVQGFKEGRMDKINHDNKQYNLNLKLMKDGSIRHGEQGVAEGWSQKYKSSINCSHPKGFSQKAHCAGKKKHNESIEMEMVCEDCGMCETHTNHENLDEACWKGYHKEGNKKMFGKTYPNCVKNTNEEQDKEQQKRLTATSPEMRKKLGLPEPKQGVAEGVAETVSMDQAKKVLRHYGADHFKTTTNELHFYKNGRPMSVDLIFNDDATRSVNLSQLNSSTRRLKGQGVAENKLPKPYKKWAS